MTAMKTKKTEKRKPRKRMVKREVKLALWLFFISIALLVGFSLWGNLVHPGSSTGAVIGIGGDVNDTANSSSDGNITITPENNTSPNNNLTNGAITLLPENNTTPTENNSNGNISNNNGSTSNNTLTGGAIFNGLNNSIQNLSSNNSGPAISSEEIGIATDATCPNATGNWVVDTNYTLNTNASCTTVIVNNSAYLIVNGSYFINATNITVETGSSIYGDGKGCSLSTSPMANNTCRSQGTGAGYGEGADGSGGATPGGGGGYGGYGGAGGNAGGNTYGSALHPDLFGSGGGIGAANGSQGGGGIRLIIRNLLLLNGTVTANGSYGQLGTYSGGGGSGGSIWVSTYNLTGTGRFTAGGGNGYNGSSVDGGGGGGGRIAVYFNVSTLDPTTTTTAGGTGAEAGEDGEAGTIFFVDTDDNSAWIGDGMSFNGSDSSTDGSFKSTTGAEFTFKNITLINDSALESTAIVTAENFTINPPTMNITCRLQTTTNLTFALTKGIPDTTNVFNLSKGLNLTNTTFTGCNYTNFYLGNTNFNFNNSVLNTTGENYIVINSSSWVNLSNGAQLLGNFNISVTNLTIDATSIISATTKGCIMSQSPKNTHGCASQGTGAGVGEGADGSGAGTPAGGGGYGGYGGAGGNAGGNTYGSALHPDLFGSGGGSGLGNGSMAGGVIRIFTRNQLLNNGQIITNGSYGQLGTYSGGGGSGGSIWVSTYNLTGTGRFTAGGGAGYNGSGIVDGGGGAGGRIAIYFNETNVSTLSNSLVSGGTGNEGGKRGEAGTIFFVDTDGSSAWIGEGMLFDSADFITLGSFKTAANSAFEFINLTGFNVTLIRTTANVTLNTSTFNISNSNLSISPGGRFSIFHNGSFFDLNNNYTAINLTNSRVGQFYFSLKDKRYGQIDWINNFTSFKNLSRDINISNNSIFVNSSSQAIFNVSANLSLFNLPFANISLQVDVADNGTFQSCPATTCTFLNYTSGLALFNVTRFTSYRTIEGDTINPQLSITLPINNSNHSSNKMSIEGTASDANQNTISVNYTAFGSNLGTYANWNFTNTTMNEGTFNVLVTASDTAGNTNNSMITFTIDRTSPNVQGFYSPLSRQNFTTGNTVVFNATIPGDSGTDLQGLKFQLENGTNGLVNLSSSGAFNNFSITIGSGSGIAEGNRTVTIFANDTAGNMNNSVSTTFVVDQTAPKVIQLYNLTEKSNISKNVPTFSFQVNDSLSPTLLCELIVDAVVNITAISAANGSTVNQVASRSLVDGNHNWSVNCNDSVRLSNVSITNNFTIDTTNPALSITLPINNSNHSTSKMSLEGTAGDTTADRVAVNSSAFGSNLGNYTNWNFTNTTMNEGTFNVLVTANDSLGNANSSLVTFTIDRTAPDAQGFNTPLSRQNFTTGNTVIFNASISNGSGTAIHVVRFQIENGTNGLVNVTPSATNGTLYNFSITIGSGIAEGNRTVTIFANDTAGNMNNSVSTTFVVDRTAPNNITLNEPSNAASQTSTTMRFNWTAMDALSSTMSCNLTVNGIVNQSNIATSNGTQTNISIDNLAVGTYSWNVTCADAVLLTNTSATQTFTISAVTPTPTPNTGGTSTGGGTGRGSTGTDTGTGETSTGTGESTKSTTTEQAIATAEEVQQLLRDQRFDINVVPAAVATVTQEQRPTPLQTALTGRAIGPLPARPVERRSIVNLRKVGVTFVNKGTKAIRIAPSVKDRSPIKLANEQRTKELVQQRIRAALLQKQTKSTVEAKRVSIARETTTRNIATIEKSKLQLQTVKTIDEARMTLREALGPLDKQSSEVKTLVTEIEKVKTVAEAEEKINVVLEQQKKQNEELTKQVVSEDKVQQNVDDTIETIKKVEEERVQFISTTKTLAPQKGLFFLPTVDGSVSYSGGHTTGALLKTGILNAEETIVPAGQNLTTEYDIRLPITLTPKPVTLSFATEGEEILAKEVDVKENVRIGTALHVDPQQGIIDTYILIPKSPDDTPTSEKKYLLEFNINERQSLFFPSSRYSEMFGPYSITQNTIFAQELSYDPQAYSGTLPVSLKIYENGEIVAENDYTVDFGSGNVKEGFDLSLLTGFAVTGRAVFATFNQKKQIYSTYLIDGLLFLVLAFFSVVGIVYLRRMAMGVIQHKPFTGAVPRRKVTLLPQSIRSLFFEKELSTLNQRLSSLEKEEISGLLRQEELLTKREIGRGEEVSRIIPPQIIPQPDRYKILDKELLKVQSAIEKVEKTELQRTKIRTLLSSYHPATTVASERKTVIDKELESVTKTLMGGERRPASLLERLFSAVNSANGKDAKRTTLAVRRIDRERKQLKASPELIEIERKIFGLDRIKEENVNVRRDIPTLLERGKQTIREILFLEKEKSKIERNLGSIGENKIATTLQRVVQPTAELKAIERQLASVERGTGKLKGKVLANMDGVNVYERESELGEVLRRQRPRQKEEVKSSPELEKIEREIKDVEKIFWQKKNVRTSSPSSIRAGQNAAVEELRRLKEEYRNVELLLNGEIQETLRKRRMTAPILSPELLNVERKIAQVETMLPERMKIKREMASAMSEKEQEKERKVAMDKELDQVTRTLQRAEKRPSSLLESLFPGWKSKQQQKMERAAVRDVVRINDKMRGRNERQFGELGEVEQRLADVEREVQQRKGKVLTNVSTVNVYGRETDIRDVLREQRPIKQREVKSSAELAEIDRAIQEVEKPFSQKKNIRTTILSSIPPRQSAVVEELRKLSQEYHDVDQLLKGEIQETLRKRRINIPRSSPELRQVENKIAQVETMFPLRMKIKRETASTIPEKEQGKERRALLDKELDQVTRTLQQAEKRSGSLLESLFPRWKSREERKMGRAAVREVAIGSGKGGVRNEKHARELETVEQRLADVEREAQQRKGKVLTNVSTVNVYGRETDIRDVLREQRPIKQREVKSSAELVEIDQAIKEVEKPFSMKKVRTTLPDRQQTRHSSVNQLQLSKEYQNVDALLTKNGLGRDNQRRKEGVRRSPELLQVEEKLAGMDSLFQRRVNVRREVPRSIPEHEEEKERRLTIDRELEEINRALEQREKRLGSGRRLWKTNPKRAKELLTVEQKLRQMETAPMQKVNVTRGLSPFKQEREQREERKEIIDQELENIDWELEHGEKKPASLLGRLFTPKRSGQEKKKEMEMIKRAAHGRKEEGKDHKPAHELSEVEKKLEKLKREMKERE